MMASVIRSIALAALALLLPLAAAAQPGVQLYQGSWVAESFGNDLVTGTGASAYFSAFGIPQGLLCNAGQPPCPFASTPVSTTSGSFSALGTVCTPYTVWGTSRPAKGATSTSGGQPGPKAVRYRNPFFFTAGGAPKTTACTATTTVSGAKATAPLTTNSPLRGKVMKGAPLTGTGYANVTTGGAAAGFTFAAVPATNIPGVSGMRRTTLGEFNNIPPYLYSYTYATLRGDAANFFAGGGPGNYTRTYKQGANTVAKAVIKAGANQFGGTMKLLGQLTTKVCYFRNGGCSLGGNNWRYEAIGAGAAGGNTGYTITTYTAMYYHTNLMQTSTILLSGDRFPWTTGSVTVTATGRGPHKTVVRRKGADNRAASGSTAGQGTVQLVTPILTRWLQPAANFETGGIAILKLTFVPEPGKITLLVAGLSMLGVLYRFRGK